jgi:hypothetical protein
MAHRGRPPRIGDPDADHLYNRAARSGDEFSLHHCEPFVDEACDHGAIESMGKEQQVLRDAVRNVRE